MNSSPPSTPATQQQPTAPRRRGLRAFLAWAWALAALATPACNVGFSERAVDPAVAPDTADDIAPDTAAPDLSDTPDAADTPDLGDDGDRDTAGPGDVSTACARGLPGFAYARTLTVTASDAPVGAGYSVSFALDAATLRAEGKLATDSTDLRLAFCRDGELESIPVALDPSVLASGALEAVPLWFALQAPLEVGASDDRYVLVYGNPQATGSVLLDWDGVFLASGLWNGADHTPLEPAFTAAVAGTGEVVESDAGLTLRTTTPEGGAVVATSAPLPADRRVAVRQLFTLVSATDGDLPGMLPLALYANSEPAPGQPLAPPVGIYATVAAHVLAYVDADGQQSTWTTSGWSTTMGATPPAADPDVALTYELFSDGESWRVVISDAGLTTTYVETAPVAWAQTRALNEPLWLGFGDDSTVQNSAVGRAGYTWVRRYVDPEPTVALGAEREVPP